MSNDERIAVVQECKRAARAIVVKLEDTFGAVVALEATTGITMGFDALCRMEKKILAGGMKCQQ